MRCTALCISHTVSDPNTYFYTTVYWVKTANYEKYGAIDKAAVDKFRTGDWSAATKATQEKFIFFWFYLVLVIEPIPSARLVSDFLSNLCNASTEGFVMWLLEFYEAEWVEKALNPPTELDANIEESTEGGDSSDSEHEARAVRLPAKKKRRTSEKEKKGKRKIVVHEDAYLGYKKKIEAIRASPEGVECLSWDAGVNTVAKEDTMRLQNAQKAAAAKSGAGVVDAPTRDIGKTHVFEV